MVCTIWFYKTANKSLNLINNYWAKTWFFSSKAGCNKFMCQHRMTTPVDNSDGIPHVATDDNIHNTIWQHMTIFTTQCDNIWQYSHHNVTTYGNIYTTMWQHMTIFTTQCDNIWQYSQHNVTWQHYISTSHNNIAWHHHTRHQLTTSEDNHNNKRQQHRQHCEIIRWPCPYDHNNKRICDNIIWKYDWKNKNLMRQWHN
jgi:hypothetical protein